MFGKHILQVNVVFVGCITLLVAACGQDLDAHMEPSSRPRPTEDRLATVIADQQARAESPSATPPPTASPTPVPPTVTLEPTDTPRPTRTTVPPTRTPTNTPTDTPTASATVTTTATVTVSKIVSKTATQTQAAVAQAPPTVTATASPTPTPEPTIPPTNTPLPTLTPVPVTPTPYPTNTPRPTSEPTAVAATTFDASGEINDHYWLARPFPRDPSNQVIDYASRNYPYGSTAGGQFQTHHGMDYQNMLGTAILAVARGTVFYAGNDLSTQFGPRNDFYGNLVVIQHDIPAPNGDPLYTLYGHMFRVEVETGQRVEAGDKLGSVGSTGAALGSHLHLEVRLGDPFDYGNTYNPDLWVRPWPGFGTLAGRVFDRDGNRLYDLNIVIQPENGPARYTYSYADDHVNSDPYYGEHWTYGDLPAGNYQVMVRLRGVLRYKQAVTVEAGKTTWLEIHVN